MPAQTGSIDVKANKLAATFSVGKSHIFYAYAADTPTALAVGDQWFVLEDITVDGSTVTTCTSLKRWDGTSWAATTVSDGVFTRINAGSILVGILRAITIQGPTSDTFWNLATGEWQSHGEGFTVTEMDPLTEQPQVWIIDMDANINGGTFTIHGEHDNLLSHRSTDYAQFGPFVQNIIQKYWSWYRNADPGTAQWFPGSYAYAGLKMRGDWIDSYIQSYFSYTREGDPGWYKLLTSDYVGTFKPAGHIGPDEIVLGDTEDIVNPETDASIQAKGYEDAHILEAYAPRNKLIMRAGSFVRPDESIEFEEYYTFKETEDSQGNPQYDIAFQEFEQPFKYRPVWPYKPGDTVALSNGTHYWGCLYSSGAQIRLTIPLARPMSEYITGATLTGGQIQVCNVGGTQLFANANIPAHTTALLNAGDAENAIDLAIERTSGNWGATTVRQTVMVRFTNTVITFT